MDNLNGNLNNTMFWVLHGSYRLPCLGKKGSKAAVRLVDCQPLQSRYDAFAKRRSHGPLGEDMKE